MLDKKALACFGEKFTILFCDNVVRFHMVFSILGLNTYEKISKGTTLLSDTYRFDCKACILKTNTNTKTMKLEIETNIKIMQTESLNLDCMRSRKLYVCAPQYCTH